MEQPKVGRKEIKSGKLTIIGCREKAIVAAVGHDPHLSYRVPFPRDHDHVHSVHDHVPCWFCCLNLEPSR